MCFTVSKFLLICDLNGIKAKLGISRSVFV